MSEFTGQWLDLPMPTGNGHRQVREILGKTSGARGSSWPPVDLRAVRSADTSPRHHLGKDSGLGYHLEGDGAAP